MIFPPHFRSPAIHRRGAAGIAACIMALAVLASVPPAVQAQSGETYFHTAANEFIGGDNAAALAAVNAGLQRTPNDVRLNRLKEEIEKKQEEQKKQDQQQQNQQQQQDGQQQDQQDPNGDDQQEQNGQPPEQQDPGEQGDQPQQPDPQKPGEAPEQEPGEDEQEQQARPQPDPSQLSRAEAERILQALGNEEETLLRRVARPQNRPRRVEKDW